MTAKKGLFFSLNFTFKKIDVMASFLINAVQYGFKCYIISRLQKKLGDLVEKAS